MTTENKISPLGDFVTRKSFALTIVFVLIVSMSIFSWLKVPIEVMPKENTPPFLYVHVNSKVPMTPDRAELALTLPVEGAVRTVSGIQKLTSSTSAGGVSLSLYFKPRTNLDVATFALQEALQELEGRGILNMKGVSISRLNPDDSAIMKFSVSASEGSAQGGFQGINPLALKEDLRLGLEAIGEVSKVEISGLEQPTFQYDIESSRLNEFGLGSQGISGLLNFQSLRESIGQSGLGSANSVTSISARMALSDLNQLREKNVAPASPVTLKDIASERIIRKEKEEISRKNGEAAIFLEVFNKDGANLFEMNKHVLEYLAGLKAGAGELDKLNFEPVFNRVDDLKKAISDVFRALYEAVLITFVIVFFFMRKWRQTALISLTIPITLLMTILVMYIKGVSLNILTLSGLILGIGMVVDSAILVVSRVSELSDQGRSPIEASALGVSGVFNALLMSTLTNAAIFLPIAFIDGNDSFTDILKAFQLPIVASLGAALLMALVFLPIAMMLWQPRRATARANGSAGHVSGAKDGSSENLSVRVLAFFRWVQKRRVIVLLGTGLVVFAVVQFVAGIAQTDLEAPRDLFSTLNVKFVPESKPDERRKLFEALERDFIARKNELGYRFMISDFNPQFLAGSLTVYPPASDDSDRTMDNQDAAIKRVVGEMKAEVGMSVSLGFDAISVGAQQKMDAIEFAGPKMAKLSELMATLKLQLQAVAGVESVKLGQEEDGDRSFVFIPNEPVLAQVHLTLPLIAAEITSAMASASVSNLKFNGQIVGAHISVLPPGGSWTLNVLRELKIRVSQNRFVNLLDLGQLVPRTFTRSVNRSAGIATGRIIVRYREGLDPEALRNAQYGIYRAVNGFTFPQGYGRKKQESEARVREMQEKSAFIIGLSGIIIYLLLGAMFESFLLPFAILFTVPLALLFGVAGLKAFGMDLDVMARLSLVILVGTCVNSAIILIDLITQLSEQGIRREDAVALGCARRLKAVFMTMSIQIIGVLPVAMGKAKIMGIPYSSLGVSIICGTLFSTLITLVVLPMVYETLDQVEQKIKKTIFG